MKGGAVNVTDILSASGRRPRPIHPEYYEFRAASAPALKVIHVSPLP
jgi:hypothetical protein